METYTTAALSRISGISRDQLMRWERANLLRPERRAQGKFYSRDQALGVMALGELRRAGVSDRHLRRTSALLPGSIAEHAYLIFDGRIIYARSTAAEVVELQSQIGSACRVLRVKALMERLA